MSSDPDQPHRRPPTADRQGVSAGTWGLILIALILVAGAVFWASGAYGR